jgi:uncharacterized lipoprotein YddW (UPF0748 family)
MKEYNKFLQTYLDYSMNTVIFQVRPMMDAFYKSELNPYSTYLVGSQGYQLD